MANLKTRLCQLFVVFVFCIYALPAVAASAIGVAKNAEISGRQVTLEFYLENIGDTALTNVTLTDDLDAAFGSGNYSVISAPAKVSGPAAIIPNSTFNGSTDQDLLSSGTLAASEAAVISVIVEITVITDQGLGLGTYQNQATAAADGENVSDLSDEGTDPDPNGNADASDEGEDDPTTISLTAAPKIGLAKKATLNGTQVTLDFYLECFQNQTISSLSLTDNLNEVFGAGNYTISSAPALIDLYELDPDSITLNPGYNGSTDTELISSGTMYVGSSAQIQMVVDIDTVVDRGNGFGVYQNQATISGTGGGKTATDLSDDGTDPDPDGDGDPREADENDVTVFTVGEEPMLGVAKTADVTGSVVTIDLYLENFGNVTLGDLSLIDDLNSAFGAGNFFISSAPELIDDPGTLTLNNGYDGNFDTELLTADSSSLASGDTAQIRFDVTILAVADLGSGLGIYQNQAVAWGMAPGGGTIQDSSDNGDDPDPNGNGNPTESGENDPTPVTVTPLARIGIAKKYVLKGFTGGNPIVRLVFTLTNYGNQAISSLTISDDLNAVYGAGNFTHLQDPAYLSGSPTLNYNAAYNGNTNTTLLNAGSTLGPGESVSFYIESVVVSVTDQGFGTGIYQNQVTVNGLDPSANPVSDVSHKGSDPDPDADNDPVEQDPTVIDVNSSPAIGIAKDVSVSGSQVTFDFYLENIGDVEVEQLDIIDNLDTVFGSGNYSISTSPYLVDDPGTISLNAAYDGVSDIALLVPASSSLTASDTAQIRMVIDVATVENVGLGLGNYSNEATITGLTSLGGEVSDTSDFGTDPDPDGDGNANEAGENDATTFSISTAPIGVAKTAAVSGNVATINLYLENLSGSTLSDITLLEDLDATFGTGNYTITSSPSLIVDPGTLNLNSGFDGGSDANMLGSGSTLASGATAQIQMVVRVDTESDQGNGYGVYSNQALAEGTQPDGTHVADYSDDGTDPDPNGNNDPGESGEDDPTPIVINVNPVIGIAKKAYVNGTLVTFDFYIENLGDATLTNIYMEDSLNNVFGSGNYSIQTQPTHVSGPGTLSLSPQFFGFNVFNRVVLAGQLRPGEVEHFRTQINVNTVTDVGNGFGIYLNSVTVTATDPEGNSLSDISDDGYDPDPNGNGSAGDAGEDDATQITIGDESNLGVAKDVSVNGTQVTFDYYLENFGNSTMSDLALTEDFDAVFGAGNYSITSASTFIDDPGTINLNAGFSGSGDTSVIDAGSTLGALDTAQIRIVVTVSTIVDQGSGVGNYQNQVTVSGVSPLGTLCRDYSDSGTDPDPDGNGFPFGDGEDDPCSFSVPFQSIGAAKTATVSGSRVTFDFYIKNLGAGAFSSVSLPEDLDAVFGAGNYTLVSGPTRISPPRELVVNPGFNGSTDTELVSSGGIGLGVTEQIRIVVDVDKLIDSGSGLGIYTNQVTVDADGLTDLSDDGTVPDPNGNLNPGDAGEDDPTQFTVAQNPVLGAAKTASIDGRTVTFDIYLENFGNVTLSNVSLTDDLDDSFGAGNYSISSNPVLITDPGTLTLNAGFDGSSDPEILEAGSTLAIGAVCQIRMSVMVSSVTDQGSGLGNYDNQATAAATAPDSSPASDLSDNGTDPDPNGNDDPTESGENDPTPIVLEASLGDLVWNDLDGDGVQDAGEPGLSGVTVFLDTNSNGVLDAGEVSESTNAGGSYGFSGLSAGSYTVDIEVASLPTGYNLTTANLPLSVNLYAGEIDNAADFGYQQQNASAGGLIWNDANGDGIRDGGEIGIDGVTLDLYLDTDGSGTLNVGDSLQTTRTTAGGGAYDFTGLSAGNYIIDVTDTGSLLTDFVITGGTDPLTFSLTAGQDKNDADFGYQTQNATAGDLIWSDANGNGIRDAGEIGIDGVTLDLYLDTDGSGTLNAGDSLQATRTTSGGGAYDFTGLSAGNYIIDVTDTGSVLTDFVITGGTDPLAFSLAEGQDKNDADFGYQEDIKITVTTAEVSEISDTTATCGGTVTNEGPDDITAKGVCWSMSANPTVADSFTDEGPDAGSFTSGLTNLTGSTTYYVRAYASTDSGTVYGNERTFQTAIDDGDMVSFIEESGPDGDDPTYDGNGDNIPDSTQSNVASFHTFDGSKYVTIAVPDGLSLQNITPNDNPSPGDAPDGVLFPYGFLGITISGLDPGGATILTLFLPEGETVESYWKYGPTAETAANHWYEFINDFETGAEINGNLISIAFVDGGRGDSDLLENGIIVDPGAPSTIFVIPTLNEWGMIVLTLLLIAFSRAAIRKT